MSYKQIEGKGFLLYPLLAFFFLFSIPKYPLNNFNSSNESITTFFSLLSIPNFLKSSITVWKASLLRFNFLYLFFTLISEAALAMFVGISIAFLRISKHSLKPISSLLCSVHCKTIWVNPNACLYRYNFLKESTSVLIFTPPHQDYVDLVCYQHPESSLEAFQK